MRPLVAALLLLAVMVSPVLAASAPPPGLAGTLTITASDATSVTLHAEQTGGSPVTLVIEHYCYQGDTYAGFERVRFTGSTDAEFNIGPRTYHGKALVPDNCWALLEFFFSSGRLVLLAQRVTLP